jgi:Holliday junction resolvase RusA-like endonuclease
MNTPTPDKISLEGEIHSSKNSRRIMRNQKTGLPFIAKSRSSKLDEASLSLQLACQYEKWKSMTSRCEYPIIVIFSFRRATRRRFDYANMAQGILDAMVKADYIPDDCADYVIPLFVPYIVDKDNAGCDLMVIASGEAQQGVLRAAIAAAERRNYYSA